MRWLSSKPKDKDQHLFWKFQYHVKKQRNTLLKIHPNRSWAAFVAGLILVLMTELGVRFEDSISMLVSSAVPEGKAVSSSASVEFASMAAIAAARGLNICPRDLALLCQKVENHIVGAPCGVRDQMTSACGEANKLLAMVCQHWWCRLRIHQSWYLYGLKDDKVYCFFDLVLVIT